MMPLFSYFFNPNSNSGKDAFNQAKDHVGSKGLLRKSITKIINSAASICGLHQRSARAYECGPLFQFAIAFTTEGKRGANFKLSNYIGTIIRESVGHLSISSNAVTKRLSKAGTPDFLRAMLDMYNRIIMHKRPKYGFTTAADMLCKLARVADCLTIDGTYIDVLRSDNYDCRAGDGKYGIGLHCLTSLMTGTIVGFSVTPAACNERLYVQIEQLANVLIMADRGYPSFQIFADLIRRGASHGVKFIFRAVPCFTMDVLNAVNADGQPVNLTAVNGAVDTSNRANHTIDMIVRMHRPKDSKVKEKTLKLRVVRVYRPHDGSWTYYVTNIDQSDMPPRMFPHAYRLRWVCKYAIFQNTKTFTFRPRSRSSPEKIAYLILGILQSSCQSRFLIGRSRTFQTLLSKYCKFAREKDSTFPERVHPHMLRRTRATLFYQENVPYELVSGILGHERLETTAIYAAPSLEMIREAVGNGLVKQHDEPPRWKGLMHEVAQYLGPTNKTKRTK